MYQYSKANYLKDCGDKTLAACKPGKKRNFELQPCFHVFPSTEMIIVVLAVLTLAALVCK